MTNIDELIGRTTRLRDGVELGKTEFYDAKRYYDGCLLCDAVLLLDVVKTLLCRAADTRTKGER